MQIKHFYILKFIPEAILRFIAGTSLIDSRFRGNDTSLLSSPSTGGSRVYNLRTCDVLRFRNDISFLLFPRKRESMTS